MIQKYGKAFLCAGMMEVVARSRKQEGECAENE